MYNAKIFLRTILPDGWVTIQNYIQRTYRDRSNRSADISVRPCKFYFGN